MPRTGEKLQPALEVDRFIWPAECLALHETAGGAIQSFAARLSMAARGGKRRVALVGAAPGAGTTTTCLSLARLAQSKQGWWGLLDADFAGAGMAGQLGIGQVSGWQAVLAGRQRLADISIASLDDRLILVPLSSEAMEAQELTAHYRLPGMVSTLSDAVELLLVDAGTVSDVDTLAALVQAARIDSVYLVYDERSMSPREMAACAGRLRAAEIAIDGTIANFADA
jgi:Mrp family chromosome partitioning ATPase